MKGGEKFPKLKKKEQPQAKPQEEIGEMNEYVKFQWEQIKGRPNGLSPQLREGVEIGVPKEELDRYVEETIKDLEKQKSYGLVFEYKKELAKFGIRNYSKEDIKKEGEALYKRAFKERDYMEAERLADRIYGEDSEEFKKARAASGQETIERIKRLQKKIK